MMQYKNLAITGAKGTGKSTLAQWILEQTGIVAAGFQTVKYDQTEVGPLYQMVDISTGRSQPISQLEAGAIRGIPESFDNFGTTVIQTAIASEAKVLLLDEIGRFERNSHSFLSTVKDALDCRKRVILVLKQEDLPYIRKVKERADTFVIDLDEIQRETAYETAQKWQDTF